MIDGASVVLEPGEAQNFSLALHELTTNAAKHGALSVPHGRVEVRWWVTETDTGPLLQFEWRERNGPTVPSPSRQGFGSSLLRQVFPKSQLDFDPDGLSCRIDLTVGRASAHPGLRPPFDRRRDPGR